MRPRQLIGRTHILSQARYSQVLAPFRGLWCRVARIGALGTTNKITRISDRGGRTTILLRRPTRPNSVSLYSDSLEIHIIREIRCSIHIIRDKGISLPPIKVVCLVTRNAKTTSESSWAYFRGGQQIDRVNEQTYSFYSGAFHSCYSLNDCYSFL